MKSNIYEIIETLKEGQEITLVLRNGEQVTGLYRFLDGEQIVLRAKSGGAPSLGWNISDIDDILSDDAEPAGDVVRVEVTDVKTGRKIVITLDMSGETGKANMEFVPTIHRDEKGLYVFFASKFMELLTQ